MTPDQLITKAVHCLRTGQPNMATLYLRKADQLVTADRQQLKHELRELKYRDLEVRGLPVSAALARITDSFTDMADAVTAVFKANMPSLYAQSSYALAGPGGRP